MRETHAQCVRLGRSVLYWFEYLGITSKALYIRNTVSEAAPLSLLISTATCNTNEIAFES